MNYKIVFCDLDGTLLNSHHQLSTNNANAIKNLNVPFIVVSARMPKGITCFTEQLNINYPICAYNGAYIINDDQIINNQIISPDLVQEIVAVVSKNQAHLSIYQKDEWYIERHDQYSQNEAAITGIEPLVANFANLELTNVNKLLVISSLVEIEDIFGQLMRFQDHLSIVKSKPDYIEIMPRSVSKKHAIRQILDHYCLNIEEAVAIGDNYNDEPMIETVGYGILMNNAPEDLKTKYTSSLYTNDQDGVSHILNELFTKK